MIVLALEALMQVKRAGNISGLRDPGCDGPSVNRQVIGSSPIAGASYMASDLRECMSSDGGPAGLTGFRLWGFVGILVRRPGFWSSPFVGRAGEDGLAVWWFCGSAEFPAAQRAWPVQGRVHATEDRGPHLAFARCAVVQAGVSGCIARTCRAVPGRSFGQGRRATRPWAGRREVAEACRSAEYGARIAGPGPGHARAQRVRLAAVAGPGCMCAAEPGRRPDRA